MDSAYQIAEPAELTSGVVFASPHSGRFYPDAMMARSELDGVTVRSSEDAFVDELFAAAPRLGAPLITATYPRAYVDLNRAADELDPAVIEGIKLRVRNPRVACGLGVIPRVVANGRTIYRGKLTRAEAEARLARVWYPYHSALNRLVMRAKQHFGQAIVVDCHSMPTEALDSHPATPRPDVVLGDRFGASASAYVVDALEEAFVAEGFTVARNIPFAGAYTTLQYGRPSAGCHAVQVELDRALYLRDGSLERNESFHSLKARLDGVMRRVVQAGGVQRLAAE